MLSVDIPGFGNIQATHLVSDFTGTLSVDGILIPGVREKLLKIQEILTVHVVTADTFGQAKIQLDGIDCRLHVISGDQLDVQKEHYVRQLGADHVVAIGNGNNDRLMLKAARLGIAVVEAEGGAVGAIQNSDILVRGILDGLSLLLNQKRIVATLRT